MQKKKTKTNEVKKYQQKKKIFWEICKDGGKSFTFPRTSKGSFEFNIT